MSLRNRFSFDLNGFQEAIDSLDRKDLVRSIFDDLTILDDRFDRGVIGVYGSWGAGKSHVLAQVIKACIDNNHDHENIYIIPCIFQAWKYETEGDLAPGLIRSLLKLADHDYLHGKLSLWDSDKSKEEFKKIGKELLSIVLELSIPLIPGVQAFSTALIRFSKKVSDSGIDALQKQPGEEDAAIDKVQAKMQELVESILNQAKQVNPHRQYRLVVFIDDLDRCSPKNMVRLFEWLKNHLLVENCVYVLGLDHMAAARAVVGEYKNYLSDEDSKDLAYGLRYLEKLVDSEYELAPSERLEKMAIQTIYPLDNEYRQCEDLEELAVKIASQDFAGVYLVSDLIKLECLRTPRTVLKIMTKFSRVIETCKKPEWKNKLQNVKEYPFWILFLTAMYYQLSPDELIGFVEGKSELYKLMSNSDSNIGANIKGPRANFANFAYNFQRKTEGKVRVPDEERRQMLWKLVTQS
jgi:hypothetical protein